MELLSRPEIQSAVIPFMVSLVIGFLLKSYGLKWSGLGVVIGFFAAALAINGFDFTPLNGTRKIILLGLLAAFLAIFVEQKITQKLTRTLFLIVFTVAAVAWVFWVVISRGDIGQSLIQAVSGIAYVCWFVVALTSSRKSNIAHASAGLALTLGTGVIAILGTSALLGQLAFALAASIGAIFLINVFLKAESTALVFGFPVAILAGLIGFAGLMFATVPWYALVMMAFVPLTVFLNIVENRSRFVQAVIFTLISLTPAALAAFSMWWFAEQSSGY